MSPLIYKVYRRIEFEKHELIASFRNEGEAWTFMTDAYHAIPYRFAINGTRIVIKRFGKIHGKMEYKS